MEGRRGGKGKLYIQKLRKGYGGKDVVKGRCCKKVFPNESGRKRCIDVRRKSAGQVRGDWRCRERRSQIKGKALGTHRPKVTPKICSKRLMVAKGKGKER